MLKFTDIEIDKSSDEVCVAILPFGISDYDQLMKSLYETLELPGYFGFNWNALEECLRDFHWLHQKQVILVHKEIPELPKIELMTYLDVLAYSVHHWKPGEAHSLEVIFPSEAQTEVLRLLRQTETWSVAGNEGSLDPVSLDSILDLGNETG